VPNWGGATAAADSVHGQRAAAASQSAPAAELFYRG
jgi:hypothetical protein